MNIVTLIGRLTKEPELKTSANNVNVARFTLAVDRGKNREGESLGADFLPITVFGNQAIACNKYLSKGSQVAVHGKMTSGSYQNNEGKTVYTINVNANSVEFLNTKNSNTNNNSNESVPEGFQEIDDVDIPF